MRGAMTTLQQQSPLDRALSLSDLFRQIAAIRGNAPAVRDSGRTLSYHELDLLSDRLAAKLVQAGIRPGDVIGLALERSADIPIAVLSTLKARAAYVPLEPTFPAERLRYLVNDAGITLIVGDAGRMAGIGFTDIPVVSPETEGQDLPPLPPLHAEGSDVAYVMHTSGSTGVPKGCAITHSCVIELLRSTVPLLEVTAQDRITLFHPFIFDASVFELWLAMATGATSVVVPFDAAQSPPDFLALLRQESVTLISQVPTAFRALAFSYDEAGRPPLALRRLLLGGESVDLDLVSAFLKNYQGTRPTVVNVYGPTEATCVATCRVLTQADLDGSVRSPIGSALPHLLVEVRGEELEPIANGEVGELVIAGPSVAVGYLGRPELTAERFVVVEGPSGPLRYYRTGDLARRLPDGSFEYLGRNDQQVKVRGARVELYEVEAVLRTHELVKEAAATVITTKAGSQFFVACVVLTDKAPANPQELLRRHMSDSLPRFMVPDRYQVVPELPLTGSGKLDRRAIQLMATPRRAR